MIDRKSRDSLAELMRHLIAGVITNDEFESRRPESTTRQYLRSTGTVLGDSTMTCTSIV
jgi:hypothetical protein